MKRSIFLLRSQARVFGWFVCAGLLACSGSGPPLAATGNSGEGGEGGSAGSLSSGSGGEDPLGGQGGAAGETGGTGTSTQAGEGGTAGTTAQGGEGGLGGTDSGGAGSGVGVDGGSAGVDQGICGDGFRLSSEECDDGNSSDGDACVLCSVVDFLAVSSSSSEPPPLGRILGEGRHPLAADSQGLAVAVLDVSGSAPVLQLARFAPDGTSLGAPVTVAEQLPLWDTHPVVAPLPQGHAVVWTALDDDELGVWMRRVPPGEGPLPAPVRVNTSQDFGQFEPDVLWDGQQLLVAWVDGADLDSGYDLRFRSFDANLSPTSGEQVLAATLDAEARVALAPFQGSGAAAWRSLSGGLERIQVRAGGESWSVGPFVPGPSADRPALAELDAGHLLLVFSSGVATEGDPAPPSSQLSAVVLSLAQSGEVPMQDIQMVEPFLAAGQGLPLSQPNLIRAGSEVWMGWRSGAAPGNALAEELWIKPIGWSPPGENSPGTLDLSLEELPLPRQAPHRDGDQRFPALAALPAGENASLALAWEDLGRVFAPAGGDHEVVLQLAPLPLLRLEGSL